jgi:hypothetical protein
MGSPPATGRGLVQVADATRRAWLAGYERLVLRVAPQPRCELIDPLSAAHRRLRPARVLK